MPRAAIGWSTCPPAATCCGPGSTRRPSSSARSSCATGAPCRWISRRAEARHELPGEARARDAARGRGGGRRHAGRDRAERRGDLPSDVRGAVRERREPARRAAGRAPRGRQEPVPRARQVRPVDRGHGGGGRGAPPPDRARRAARRPRPRAGDAGPSPRRLLSLRRPGRPRAAPRRRARRARRLARSGALGQEAERAAPVAVIDGVPHRVFQRALATRSGFPPAYQVGLYSLAEPLARERELGAEMLAFGGLALALALVASLVLSRSLAVPIRELAAAAAAVGRGNLRVAVPVRSRDEVGRLAAAFNEMTAGLALKERYRSVLDLVADREVADDLIAGRLTLGGELREASVVFCDVRGFTALTERMEPGEVIALLNEHMTALTRVVYANGGVVDKFVGDQVIALFGVPRSTGHDAYAAVRAAREMIEARTTLNARAARPLDVGIGVASGTVVAGCLGSADRLNYTVLGERVNLAARLCAQAGRMEVLIDDATQRRLGALVGVEAVPPLALKGFSAPVVAYRLRAVGPLPAAS